jgi:hypothetical protein
MAATGKRQGNAFAMAVPRVVLETDAVLPGAAA